MVYMPDRALQPGQSLNEGCPFFVPKSPKPKSLSKREAQVITLVGRGLTTAEIAQELLLGERTIVRYIGNAMTKLNAPNRTCAVVIALNWQMVTFDAVLAN